MNILKIAIGVALILFILYVLGMVIMEKRLKRLIRERNGLDLSTEAGRARNVELNKRIDRIYGFNTGK